jgi:hypothetical protein
MELVEQLIDADSYEKFLSKDGKFIYYFTAKEDPYGYQYRFFKYSLENNTFIVNSKYSEWDNPDSDVLVYYPQPTFLFDDSAEKLVLLVNDDYQNGMLTYSFYNGFRFFSTD